MRMTYPWQELPSLQVTREGGAFRVRAREAAGIAVEGLQKVEQDEPMPRQLSQALMLILRPLYSTEPCVSVLHSQAVRRNGLFR